MDLMEVEISVINICYMNISGKSEFTACIHKIRQIWKIKMNQIFGISKAESEQRKWQLQGTMLFKQTQKCQLVSHKFLHKHLYREDVSSVPQSINQKTLSDSNGIRNHNHFFRKWTLNLSAKLSLLAKFRPVWLNGRVFVYELSGCGFESHCCHFNFRYGVCFEQGAPWHSGNCRV